MSHDGIVDFRSDNVSGAHPNILEAIARASRDSAAAYGADAWSARLTQRFSELFEREVAIFPVATGTAANALGLALYTPPWGAIYCHAHAHVQVDECGAPELFTGGAKLVPVPGPDGKIDPDQLAQAIQRVGDVHAVQPAIVSVSQATESGTVYRAHEQESLAELARRHALAVHMDGARLANALATLGVSPAAATWRAGVDVLSFGATKNGCFAAEAIVLFDLDKARELAFRRKRSGHLFSKMRLLSAQLEAYLHEDLWLRNAAHANRMAARLAQGLAAEGYVLRAKVEANELFIDLPSELAEALRARGFSFYDWVPLGPCARRFVTAFDTREADVDALIAAVR